jgi:hypothetical protein
LRRHPSQARVDKKNQAGNARLAGRRFLIFHKETPNIAAFIQEVRA